MSITSANIPVLASKPFSSTSSQAVGQPIDRRQARASDGFARHSQSQQPQIIDAEFVEFYCPSTKVFNHERSDLGIAIEPDTELGQIETNRAATTKSPWADKDQWLSAPTTPLPGSIINIFA